MRIRIGLAVTLALVVVLALGSTGTSAAPAAAPSENAVVYWSGVAEGAIAAGRPPASSSVLGGMVHGAMYDAVAAVEGGLEPFATGVTAPPGASADAAVAQAARDVLVARVPGQATAVQIAYDAYMASIPDGPAKDAGKAVGAAAAAGHARDADRRSLRRRRSVRPAAAGPGRVRADRGDAAGRRQAPVRAAVHLRLAVRVAARTARRADEQALRAGRGRAAGSTAASTAPSGRAAQTETVRFHTEQTFVQYSRALRGLANARGLDLRESARLLGYVHVATADTMIACWEAKYHYYFWRPTHAIQRADTDGNPATIAGPDVAAAGRRQPSRVSVRARLLHGCGDRVAAELLRDEAGRAR